MSAWLLQIITCLNLSACLPARLPARLPACPPACLTCMPACMPACLAAVQAFKEGDVRFLICTDVAARGIDIQVCCAVCCVLCAVCCVLCAVCCVLCAVLDLLKGWLPCGTAPHPAAALPPLPCCHR
jgi:hypothetical protein